MVHKRVALYDAEERALRVILEGEQEEERQRDKDRRLKKQREKFLQKQRELDSILFGDDGMGRFSHKCRFTPGGRLVRRLNKRILRMHTKLSFKPYKAI